MKYRAMKSKDVIATLTTLVGKEGAQAIGVCRFCAPESLDCCRKTCKHGSSGIGDFFVPRFSPETLRMKIEGAAKDYKNQA